MSSSESSPHLAFVGCYTTGAGGEGEGIVRVLLDSRTGALTEPAVVGATPSPSFLLRHPAHPVLYAANELAHGEISAFSVGGDGELTALGSWPSGGADPCHLSLAVRADRLLIANYTSGTVTAHTLDDQGVPTGQHDTVTHNGRSVHPERQAGPHAHMVAPTPDGVLAVDLGVDAVFFHRLDPDSGRISEGQIEVQTRPGAGPRHLARDESGRLHVVGELDGSLTTYELGTNGWQEAARVPASLDDSTLPSEIALSGDGRFVYVGNRGPNTIAAFSLASGVPEFIGEVSTGGVWPRHFAISRGFLAVANERSHTVVTFRLDPQTGLPTPTGDVLATPSPTCVLPW